MKYKIFLLVALFSLDSAAMRPGVNQTARVVLRDEHDDVAVSAGGTIDLRATYYNAVLNRNLESFNLLLRQDPSILAESIGLSSEFWRAIVKSYSNGIFDYGVMFVGVPAGSGIISCNISKDSWSDLRKFLFAHKGNGEVDSLVEIFEKRWQETSEKLSERFILTNDFIVQFYEANQSFIRIVCGFISFCLFFSSSFISDQQVVESSLIDEKCIASCRTISSNSKIVVNVIGGFFAGVIFFSELFINWFKLKYALMDDIYRTRVKEAAEIFALYLVLTNYSGPTMIRGLFGLLPEVNAMSNGISAYRKNAGAIAEYAIRDFR